MGWLEETHARSQPFFRPILRILDVSVVCGSFLGAYLALRRVPGEPRLQLAFYLTVVGATFDSILCLWLLINRAARARWVNPIHPAAWARRVLIARSFSGLFFLGTLVALKRVVGWP